MNIVHHIINSMGIRKSGSRGSLNEFHCFERCPCKYVYICMYIYIYIVTVVQIYAWMQQEKHVIVAHQLRECHKSRF